MFKVYEVHQQISINGEKFINTALLGEYKYISEEEALDLEKPISARNFAEAVAILNTGDVWRSSAVKFFKWTFLHLSFGFDSATISERKFKSLEVRWHCEEVHPSMRTLSSELTADEFCHYLADNGWEGWQKN